MRFQMTDIRCRIRRVTSPGLNSLWSWALERGEQSVVTAESGESLRPLGFIHGDFIFGRFDPEDAGVMSAGEEISPMYEIEIRNDKGDTEARYSLLIRISIQRIS